MKLTILNKVVSFIIVAVLVILGGAGIVFLSVILFARFVTSLFALSEGSADIDSLNGFLGLCAGVGPLLTIALSLWNTRVPAVLPGKLDPAETSTEKLNERAHHFWDRSKILKRWMMTVMGASIVALLVAWRINSPADHLDIGSVISIVALYIGMPISFLIGRRVYAYDRSIKRLQAKASSVTVDLKDEEIVLYLRPFDSDGFRGSISDFETIEVKLAKILYGQGRFITVGRPEEEMPELGGVRLYFPSDQWQARVEDLLQRSRLVVIAVDDASGVMWEMEAALKCVPLERVVIFLLFQFRRNGTTRRLLYKQIQRQIRKRGMELPYNESALFIAFPGGSFAHPVSPELTPHEMLHGAITDLRISTALHVVLGKLSLGVEFEPEEEERRFKAVSLPMRMFARMRYAVYSRMRLV